MMQIPTEKGYADRSGKGEKLMSEQLTILQNKIKGQMEKFDKKRNKYRRYHIISKIISASLTVLITVLLGLTFGFLEIELWLKNVALAISAFLTVLNTFDALYDFQSRYVSNYTAYRRLQVLDFEIEFSTSGNEEGKVEPNKLEEYKKAFLDILNDDLQEWIKDRQQSIETPQLHK
jgi:hypothetical protein